MTHRWKQTINFNENMVRELIEKQFSITVNCISFLEEGWDNSIYLVNKNLIFRFPRREPGVLCMANEIALLPHIAKHVSFPLSSPQWIGQPSDLYPYPFSGYKMLEGKPLCDARQELINDKDFALKIAAWLKELHLIQVTDENTSLIKGDQSWRLDVKHRVSRCKENLAAYEAYFLEAGFKKELLLDVIEVISHFKFKNAKKSYLHGDLYHRHILVEPIHLYPTGLIDWGDIHISHPAIDLAIGMIFTPDIFEIFLDAYGSIDDESIKILTFHSFCHGMSFLPYAYEQNKTSLKNWASLVLLRTIDEIKTILN